MMKVSNADLEEIKDNFQKLVDNGIAQVITVIWSGNLHDVFTHKKENGGQLVFEEMEIPRVNPATGEGE